MKHKFAVVVGEFNDFITNKLLEGALGRFHERGVPTNTIKIVRVPGAIEIPLAAQLLAKTGKYNAILCLGAVIRGETDHYDYVCQQVSYGCQRVMLDFEVPIIFGILTTDSVEKAEDRAGGKAGHKGRDSVDTAFAMVDMLGQYFT